MPESRPPISLRGLSLADLQREIDARRLPPVDQWHPTHCGDSEMRIARDGTWYHQGQPIRRPAMVRLFSTIIRREPDGRHVLVTPVEKLDIEVESTAFRAIEMQSELATLNERWRADGRPELGVGIGLGYGEVFAGNIGSERRLEYTIIGDVVNVASRLSASARAGEILLTDELRGALHSAPEMEACPPLTLRGKSQPVPVYRVTRP